MVYNLVFDFIDTIIETPSILIDQNSRKVYLNSMFVGGMDKKKGYRKPIPF